MDYPSTRAEAKATGATHYFTGKPCKRGHVAPRETKGPCTACRKEDAAATAEQRKEYFKQWNKSEAGRKVKQKYYEANKDAVKERANRRDVEEKRKYRKTYKKTNPELTQVAANMYRRRMRECTPPWLTKEHKQQIRAVYLLAAQLQKLTGVRYSVDHEVPINGRDVCGLHVPWNLVAIPFHVNSAKGNRMA